MNIILSKSNRKGKKWQVEIDDKIMLRPKYIHFGSEGYEDYTQHRDENRKKLYIKRHEKRENWDDLMNAGSWSRWLLWEKPSLQEAIKNMEKKFKIKILTSFKSY